MTCRPDPINALDAVLATSRRGDPPVICRHCGTHFDLQPVGFALCPECGGRSVDLASAAQIEAEIRGSSDAFEAMRSALEACREHLKFGFVPIERVHATARQVDAALRRAEAEFPQGTTRARRA